MKVYFDHEKLDVYREAINFRGWVGRFLGSIPTKAAAKDQLDRACFFEIAPGSALESAAALDLLVAREVTTAEQITVAKENLVRIVEMLTGLLRKFSSRREVLREDEPAYHASLEHEHDYEHEHEN